MRRSDLGEFEELVLLAVVVLEPRSYSVTIAEAIEKETHQSVSTGATHAALQRLEKKGFVTSGMGEATAERGGRRKRIFHITVAGSEMIKEVQAVRNRFWDQISPSALPQPNLGS